jgi:hypothetical protein
MRITILITLALALASCSDDDTQFTVTPELKPVIDSFFAEAAARGKDLPKVNLIAQLGQVQAVIDVSKDGDQWVLTLDQDFYNYYTAGQLEAIIFHELGKIVLKREIILVEPNPNIANIRHNPEPISIMNPYYKFGEYGSKRVELLDELFK